MTMKADESTKLSKHVWDVLDATNPNVLFASLVQCAQAGCDGYDARVLALCDRLVEVQKRIGKCSIDDAYSEIRKDSKQ